MIILNTPNFIRAAEITATASVAPDAPSSLSVSTLSSTSLRLAWTDNSDNETGFEIYRSATENGTYSLIHTTAANAVTWDDTGLSASATWWYQVRAVNGAGQSAFSNQDSGTTNAASSNYAGLTPDYYVSSTGSDSNSGLSEGDAFATFSKSATSSSAGDIIGVVDTLSQTLDLTDCEANPGTLADPVVVVGKATFTKINGAITDGGESNTDSAYWDFKQIHFDGGSTTAGHLLRSRRTRWFNCAFQCSGGALTGNKVTTLLGSYQVHESSVFIGDAGRYAALLFQQTNTVCRNSIIRTESEVWTFDGGNPTGGLQYYSSNNSAAINCIAIDCITQASAAEYLAGIINTTNEGSSVGLEFIGCISANYPTKTGITAEGDNSTDAHFQDCISWGNNYGLTTLEAGTDITVDGGYYSDNGEKGLAAYNSSAITASNVNTVNNSTGNLSGVTDGGGNTTATEDKPAILAAMKNIGVYGSYYGDTGWKTTQASDAFPRTNESGVKSLLTAVDVRGWTATSDDLETYLGGL